MLKTLGPTLLLFVVLLCLPASLPALAGKPSGGGRGGGGTTLPPVRYQVQFWTVPGAIYVGIMQDTNSAGQTVGAFEFDLNGDGVTDTRRAYLYDPRNVNAGLAVDLNTIVSNIPAGWAIRSANAINEVGQIAAHIEPVNSPGTLYQAVMIDMSQSTPVLHAIPDGSFTSYSVAADINDWGDIAVRYRRDDGTTGHYVYNFNPSFGIAEPLDLGISSAYDTAVFINNSRVVVGGNGNNEAYRLTWNGGMEVFTELYPSEINEGGAFCGRANVKVKGNSTSQRCFLYDTQLEVGPSGYPAQDLNDSLDYIFFHTLLHRTFGALDVFSLLDPSDPDSAVIQDEGHFYLGNVINRDPVTNFPVIVGSYKGVGFTLTPVPAP